MTIFSALSHGEHSLPDSSAVSDDGGSTAMAIMGEERAQTKARTQG